MASPGRVLHLSENLTLPFDRRVWMELNALRAAGYEVSAICPMGEGFDAEYEVLGGIHVWRYPAPPPTRGFASYVWEFLYCWLQTLRLTLTVNARRGFDVIHSANPPDTFWAIALLFKPFGIKFVFDHHDLCPELYLSRFGERRAEHTLGTPCDLCRQYPLCRPAQQIFVALEAMQLEPRMDAGGEHFGLELLRELLGGGFVFALQRRELCRD